MIAFLQALQPPSPTVFFGPVQPLKQLSWQGSQVPFSDGYLDLTHSAMQYGPSRTFLHLVQLAPLGPVHPSAHSESHCPQILGPALYSLKRKRKQVI